MITIQYLEPGLHLLEVSPAQVGKKLEIAFDIFPLDCLLLGWDIPEALENICRYTTTRKGVKISRFSRAYNNSIHH